MKESLYVSMEELIARGLDETPDGVKNHIIV